MTFKRPEITKTADGSPRKVGFELEFSGLTLQQTASAVHRALGGSLEQHSLVEYRCNLAELGEFKIELDWHYLKRTAAEQDVSRWLKTLTEAAQLLVPIEVVCPPLPIDRLSELQPMVESLRQSGAVGTEKSLLAAYGVHINSEIPELSCACLTRYLQAFALLQWWLVDAHEVDITRRMSPYIDLYPESYLIKVVKRQYNDFSEITGDYLTDNPTRNRALDLLPLLMMVKADTVRQSLDEPKLNARPTFHYRLPNCQIEQPDWSLALAWNTWWVVEQLATEPDALAELGQVFIEAQRPLLGIDRKAWVNYIDQWLKNRGWQ
ncbi:MAG: amidoligase family protein [Methylococcales bacterium]|nr:amidoligase family protein [Methylococcales bacterium]